MQFIEATTKILYVTRSLRNLVSRQYCREKARDCYRRRCTPLWREWMPGVLSLLDLVSLVETRTFF